MKRILVGAMILSSLMGSEVMAQERLTVGDSILVSYSETDGFPPISVTGFFRGLSNDSLTVVSAAEGDTLRIPLFFVDTFGYYRMGHHGGDFAALGAVIGIIVGAIDASKQPKCGNSCLIFSDEEATAISLVGGAIGGGLAGYFLGRLMRTVRRVDVPVSEVAGWSLTPSVGNGFGLSASIRMN